MQLVDDAASCQAMCTVSCMNTEIRHRIYLNVVLGTREEEPGFPPTQEMEASWDEVAAEVVDIRAAGFGLDITLGDSGRGRYSRIEGKDRTLTCRT